MIKFTICVVLLCFTFGSEAWKTFHLGREKGGNVKGPHTTNHELPPDQWFTQKLDHFNPTDDRTWQQVIFCILLLVFKKYLFCVLNLAFLYKCVILVSWWPHIFDDWG